MASARVGAEDDLVAEIRGRIAEQRAEAEAAVHDAVGLEPQLREGWLNDAARAEALLELHTPVAAQGAESARCAADRQAYPCPRLRREREMWLSTEMDREALDARKPSDAQGTSRVPTVHPC